MESPTDIPRIEFDALDPDLARVLEPRYRRLGYLGEFFRCMAHQPAALAGFVEFTERSEAALDRRSVAVIALTVATACGNKYELHQHERLSVRCGLSRQWIAEIEQLEPDNAPELSAQDRSVQRWVLALTARDYDAARRLFETVVSEFGAAGAVAALMIAGRHIAHAAMIRTLDLPPAVPSIFEDGFAS